ncbi:MAG: sigma 54-interacting transcriptional regulator [Acidobacteria bacterium]|nr:sigma 54-interacting transcriptional regulator [Acidobacteriota bacterium]
MNPRAVFIAGPLKGSAFELGEGALSVGRDSTNDVRLPDSLLSRRHCRIERAGEGFVLKDLESLNGTFVNGRPVREQALAEGDRVTVGESCFVFLSGEGETAGAPSHLVTLSDRHMEAHSTVRLKAEEARYLRPPQEGGPSEDALAGIVRDLALLVRVSTSVNSVRETAELQRELLRLVFEAVPAERGAILLVGPDGRVVSEFGLDRTEGGAGAVEVSRTILRQVLEEGAAVLAGDLFEGGFDDVESIRAARLSSLLCAPLVLYGRALGAVYLTTADPATRFDEGQLELVTVICRIAAVALNNARHVEQLESENDLLRAEASVEHGMVGESPAVKKVYQFIARVAPADTTVLVRGESGTGKELAARALHQNSPRGVRPFVAINCAALTETLLESELFGHERGAFTGALAQKKGKLEVADGGTLFLDEVGEMPHAIQAKLLRVLQEREFERVGGTRTIRVDVRVVAATNRDLEEAVRKGGFRQDLYYRLNVVSFEMPALRDRREDIPLLASYFVAKYAAKFKRRVTGLSPEARACLVNYDWPGNVRELENAVERAVVLGSTERVLPEDLPETVLDAAPDPSAQGPDAAQPFPRYHDALRESKRQLILRALEQSAGNFTEAARLLGVHPNYLHRLIRNLNLRPEIKK